MKRLAFAFLLAATPAFAQQPTPADQPTPQDMLGALSGRYMQEINSGVGCAGREVMLQRELNKAKADIKQLTDKYEPKKEENKP